MHDQTTMGIHEEDVPKLVHQLCWCKAVKLINVIK